MNRPNDDPDDEFFAPVLRDPPLAVLALLAGRPLLAIPPAVVALGAAAYLVVFGVRRARSGGGPPTFG